MSTSEPLLYTTRKYPCGCSAAGSGDVPSYCSQHGVAPMPCDAWDSRCTQYKNQRDELVAALRAAVEVIKVWHNMDGAESVWPIYLRSCPEMKPIRDALAKLGAQS